MQFFNVNNSFLSDISINSLFKNENVFGNVDLWKWILSDR